MRVNMMRKSEKVGVGFEPFANTPGKSHISQACVTESVTFSDDSGLTVAPVDPDLAAWLAACPVSLTAEQRTQIVAMVRAGTSGIDA